MQGSPYTTQLQAGLGMIPETLTLLELWEPAQTKLRRSYANLPGAEDPSGKGGLYRCYEDRGYDLSHR